MRNLLTLAILLAVSGCDNATTDLLSCRDPTSTTNSAPLSVTVNKYMKTISVEQFAIRNIVFSDTAISFELNDTSNAQGRPANWKRMSLNRVTGVLRDDAYPRDGFICEKTNRKI